MSMIGKITILAKYRRSIVIFVGDDRLLKIFAICFSLDNMNGITRPTIRVARNISILSYHIVSGSYVMK